MKITLFKQSIFVSFLGHLAMFGIFAFSFGNKQPNALYSNVYFQGAILSKMDFRPASKLQDARAVLLKRSETFFLDKISKELGTRAGESYYLKPNCRIAFSGAKLLPSMAPSVIPAGSKRRQAVLMLYPALPYNLSLYFKDRQGVHIELMFKMVPSGKTSFIEIKRKISSGNLEADLLSMHYISHYLFIQQARLNPGLWQTVKIDLAPQK